MDKLQTISLYAAKDTAPISADSVCVKKGGGLEGDFRCHADKKQISISSQDIFDWMSEQKEPGLCFQKFSANLIFDGLDFERIENGNCLTFAEASIRIDKAGKRCFGEECDFYKQGGICRLKNGLLFGHAEADGTIPIHSQCSIHDTTNK